MSTYHTDLWMNAKLLVARAQHNVAEEKRVVSTSSLLSLCRSSPLVQLLRSTS